MRSAAWAAAIGLALLSVGSAHAADKLAFGPPPDWVKPLPLPTPAKPEEGEPLQALLQDDQVRLSVDATVNYIDQAAKVLSPDALDSAGSIDVTWDPRTEQVTIHQLAIVRGDQIIDVLKTSHFEIARRETGLEQAMLDGALTAALQIPGLQVGDIVRLSYTNEQRDPLLAGRTGQFQRVPPVMIDHLHWRLLADKGVTVRWQAGDGAPKPTVTNTAAGQEFVVDQSHMKGPNRPAARPGATPRSA